MTSERMARRLAAVLSLDMVGYSGLVEADEAGTLARHKAHRREIIDPAIAGQGGRIVKSTGDGLLAEFASALDAVGCALDIQRALAGAPGEAAPIRYRIGINLGDVIHDGGDVFGDGVNLADRLQGLAPPGGIAISDVVHQLVAGTHGAGFADMGAQAVKNLKRPVRAWAWRADGGTEERPAGPAAAPPPEQEIRFCTTKDGVRIAYAVAGSGPPMLKAPNWMNHLEFDWESPIISPFLRALSARHTLYRFDQRGNGLSDRQAPSYTLDDMVGDMAAVADAAGLDRFPIFAISQGCAYAISYAVRYPERVTRLVLFGGFAVGQRRVGSAAAAKRADVERDMILAGWGRNNPAFRRYFTTMFYPGATREQEDGFNEMQRRTIAPETAAQLYDMFNDIDVRDLLGRVAVPTLVLHCRDDAMVPIEAGRRIAAGIPGARFVSLDSENHVLLESEPAWPKFLAEVERFLAET